MSLQLIDIELFPGELSGSSVQSEAGGDGLPDIHVQKGGRPAVHPTWSYLPGNMLAYVVDGFFCPEPEKRSFSGKKEIK